VRKLVFGLALLMTVGSGSAWARPEVSGEAVDVRAGQSYELAVSLKPSADLAGELRALDDAQPESFIFNSADGDRTGVALGDLAPGETMAQALARLRADPRVDVVEPLVAVHADFVPNDPRYAEQWNFKQIHMEQAWNQAQGKGVTVAVIDTGIAYEDYGEFRQVPDLKGSSFAKGYNFVADTAHPDDDNGHGTHVAGTIAQATNNGEGVAGIAFAATLMPIKVLNADGAGNSADIADAIHWAVDHGAQVINMSLGGGAPSKIMARAVAYARKKGAVVVCAAGNMGRGVVEYPAAYPGAVAVSAVGRGGALAPYSSYGPQIALAAPGGDKSQGPAGGILQQTIDPSDPAKAVYAYLQGTSMAAPHVAGAAALLFSAGAKTPAEVEQALFAGAEQAGKRGWNDRLGYGVLDVAASLQALADHAKPGPRPEMPKVAFGDAAGGGARAASARLLQANAAHGLAKFALALLLAVGVAASLRKRERGTLGPALLAGLLLSAAGLWFLPRPGAGLGAGLLGLIEIPLPDWGRWLFGPGRASPLFYSALIPFGLAAVGYFWKASRSVMAGVCIGFAAFLGYCAWSGAPAISFMPLRIVAIPWLLVNLGLCLLFGRALLRKERLS